MYCLARLNTGSDSRSISTPAPLHYNGASCDKSTFSLPEGATFITRLDIFHVKRPPCIVFEDSPRKRLVFPSYALEDSARLENSHKS